MKLATQVESALDPDVVKLVDYLCKSSSGTLESKSSLSQRLDLTQARLDQLMPVLADVVHNLDVLARRKQELQINRFSTPLLYIDGCRYDETPMRVSTKHSEPTVTSTDVVLGGHHKALLWLRH